MHIPDRLNELAQRFQNLYLIQKKWKVSSTTNQAPGTEANAPSAPAFATAFPATAVAAFATLVAVGIVTIIALIAIMAPTTKRFVFTDLL